MKVSQVWCCSCFIYFFKSICQILANIMPMLKLRVEHEGGSNTFECVRPNCDSGTVLLDMCFFLFRWGIVCSLLPL